MNVLIVDDEPLVRRSLEKVFTKSGHQVQTGTDGNEGLKMWSEGSPDLVILDVLMPGRTGPEVLVEAPKNPKTAVILISAYSGDYDPDSVKSLGADAFIEKPFSDIQDVVKEALKVWEAKQS